MQIALTEDQIRDTVIPLLVEQLAQNLDTDGFRHTLKNKVQETVRCRVDAVCDEVIAPLATKAIDELILEETNKWGEKLGKTLTFREYVTARAEAYLAEKVNYDGKAKGEDSYSSWTGTQTRITHLIHKHLHYNIDNAMKDAAQKIIAGIAPSLADTVKLKIGEVVAKITVKS